MAIALANQKQRFQVAATLLGGEVQTLFAIRAVQGHSLPFVDERRLSTRLFPDEIRRLEVIQHGTKRHVLKSILLTGLQPGGKRPAGERCTSTLRPTPRGTPGSLPACAMSPRPGCSWTRC